MKKRFDIEQGTIEWLEAKWGKIGGTLSKGLLVKSDTLLIDILSQRLEDFEPDGDSYQNDAMKRGTEMEPYALQYLEKYTGVKFQKPGLIECEKNELLVISPDGLSECDKYGAEAKCPGRKAHTAILLAQETPLEYMCQIVHNFTVNPTLEKFWFISFRPESPQQAFIKEYTRETEVNLGTKAKPVMKSIEDWTTISREAADGLLVDVLVYEKQLKPTF